MIQNHDSDEENGRLVEGKRLRIWWRKTSDSQLRSKSLRNPRLRHQTASVRSLESGSCWTLLATCQGS